MFKFLKKQKPMTENKTNNGTNNNGSCSFSNKEMLVTLIGKVDSLHEKLDILREAKLDKSTAMWIVGFIFAAISTIIALILTHLNNSAGF